MKPDTPTTSPPLTLGSTSGTTSSRSVLTASSEVSSLPLPASGTSITATLRSGLELDRDRLVELIRLTRDLAQLLRAPTEICALSRLSPWTTTSAENCSPGNAACMRS